MPKLAIFVKIFYIVFNALSLNNKNALIDKVKARWIMKLVKI